MGVLPEPIEELLEKALVSELTVLDAAGRPVTHPRIPLYEEVLRKFAYGVRATQLYAADHPLLIRNVEDLLAALKTLFQHQHSVTVGIVDNQFVVADTPLPKASAGMKELIARLRANDIERISFERGVAPG